MTPTHTGFGDTVLVPTEQQLHAVPSRATTLILIRHGSALITSPDGDPFGLLDGHNDPPLGPLGRRQAEALAARLAPNPPDRIFVSGLRRTVETAAPLVHAINAEATIVPELREVLLGDWEAQYPHRVARRDPLLKRIESEQRWDLIPGAEDADRFQARVRSGLQRVIEETGPGASAAVFAHGGVISEICSLATRSQPMAFLLSENTSMTELAYLGGERWILRSFNDIGHLSEGHGPLGEAPL